MRERAQLRDEGDDNMKRKVTGWNQSWNVTQLKEHFNNVSTHLLQIIYTVLNATADSL